MADEPGAVGVSPDGDVAFAVAVVVVGDGRVGGELPGDSYRSCRSCRVADDPVGAAFDGKVGFAVAVVVAADGLGAGLGERNYLPAAAGAVDGIESIVRGAPDGDVGFAVPVVIGGDGRVAGLSPGAVIKAVCGAEDVPIVV